MGILRFRKIFKFLFSFIVVLIIFLCISSYLSEDEDILPEEFLKFNAILSNFSTNHSCHMRVPDPWDNSILSYIKKPYDSVECDPKQKNLTALKDGHLILVNEAALEDSGYSCRYRYFYHNSGVDDFTVKYGAWNELSRDGVKMESDFVEIECKSLGFTVYKYQWAHVVPRKRSIENEKPFLNESDENLSVIMIGFDGVSRSEFHRQMPKTLAQMSKMGFVEMEKHIKIGDNTFPNWMAIMLGKHTYDSDFGKSEVDYSYGLHYDNWTDLIWRRFGSEGGYATLFSEDATYQTYEIATFNYDKKALGFKDKPPADHYMRPYFLSFAGSLMSIRSTYFCYDAIPEHILQLDYLESFIKNYQGTRKFAWNWFIRIAHDYLNTIGLADQDMTDFLARTEPYLNKSIVILFSDHGNRYDSIRETLVGRLESGLPILSVHVPPWFRMKYADLFKNLQENSKMMTTHFDLHATLMDVLQRNFSTYERYQMVENRGFSLFDVIPKDRGCAKAQVPLQYCPCFQEIQVNISEGREAADFVINYVNKLFIEKHFEHKCAKMVLYEIKSVYISLPPKQISARVSRSFLINYRVVFQVKAPSEAILETIVEKNLDSGEIRFIGDIERNNRYGNTSSCTKDRVLKKLCHCL